MRTAGTLIKSLHEAPFVEIKRPWGEIALSDDERHGDRMVSVTLREPARAPRHLRATTAPGTWRHRIKCTVAAVALISVLPVFLLLCMAFVGTPGLLWLPGALVFTVSAVVILLANRAGTEQPRIFVIMYRLIPDEELGRRPATAEAQAVEDILNSMDAVDAMPLTREQYLWHQTKHFHDLMALAEAVQPDGVKEQS